MENNNIQISQWMRFSKNLGTICLLDYLERIQNGYYQKQIDALRELLEKGDKEGAENLKKNLPAVTFSAIFGEKRQLKDVKLYTNILVFDIDKLVDNQAAIELRDALSKNSYVFSSFISPSGKGVKFLVKLSENSIQENHKKAFADIANYFEQEYNIVIDRSGQDIGRLCFASYDPNLFINTISQSYNYKDTREIEKIYNKITKQYPNQDGSRNNCLFNLSCKAFKNDIQEEELYDFASKNFNLPFIEIDSCIKSAKQSFEESPKRTKQREKISVIEMQKKAEELINARYKLLYNEILDNVEYIDLEDTTNLLSTYTLMSSNYPSTISRYLKLNNCDFRTSQVIDLLKSNFVKPYHPFKQYLHNLKKWDETMNNYIHELSQTAEVEDQEQWYYDLKGFMIGIVASIEKKYRKDEVNHSMLVFISTEGEGKTTWINNLLPECLREYFYSGLPRFDDKDTLKLLHETLICNIDEIDTLEKKEFNYLKELITKPRIRMRKAYGHFAENFEHNTSFCGTLNEEVFLPSGNGQRRFAIHKPITLDYMHKVDIDMVYAQAYYLYHKGERYWLNKKDIANRKQANQSYVSISPEEEYFSQYIVKPSEDEQSLINNPPIWKTSSEILSYISNFAKLQINTNSIRKIGVKLKEQGFKTKKVKGNNLWFVNLRTEAEVKAINIFKYNPK